MQIVRQTYRLDENEERKEYASQRRDGEIRR